MATFYTILTNIGKALVANAQALGGHVNLAKIAVGDGLAGAYYNPSEDQVALKNEVWRGNINDIEVDPDNPSWAVIEAVIPDNVGGFYVREVGLFDDQNPANMIAVGKYPETHKPTMEEGAGKELYLRMIIEVSNAAAVSLTVDPTVVIATRGYVDQGVLKRPYLSIAADLQLDNAVHHTLAVNVDAGDVRLKLTKFSATPKGRDFRFKRLGDSANALIVAVHDDDAGVKNIDDDGEVRLTQQNERITVVRGDSQWRVF